MTGSLRPGCASSKAATFLLTFLHYHQHESSSSSGNTKTATLFLTSSDTGFLLQGCLVLSYLCRVFRFKGFALAVASPPSTTVPMPSRHTDSKCSPTQSGKERAWATYCIFHCTHCGQAWAISHLQQNDRSHLTLLLSWCAPQVRHWNFLFCSIPAHLTLTRCTGIHKMLCGVSQLLSTDWPDSALRECYKQC